MKIAIVGATGLVGQKILDVMEERNLPVSDLYLVASERSVGKELTFNGNKYKVISIEDAIKMKPQIAIFSAGGETSLKWAPEFAKVGTTVVDNSSAWRMDASKKLVVPEINATELTKDDKIIANPNCSTIQMVVALAPLHEKYKIERLVISTYQSITGTGVKAVQQFEAERIGINGEKAYPHEIDKNCLPHCDVFTENAYTKEEMKLVNETRKILKDDNIRVTATAVRVPVVGGHAESINIEFANDFNVEEIKQLLSETDGVIVQDNLDNNEYPMPKYSHDRDEVFVGRIRRDYSNPNSLNIWVVADNLRKGAATNAVQIAEYLAKNELV
ncbi:aspartate-semialdehyde dehydrogenase [Marinifilum sp.]|uniref:aspartate-semialdehyde dehydrogenase n=1 Tax=Marinifilum sp. TaxID=2033137 RepID=UPI003BACB813